MKFVWAGRRNLINTKLVFELVLKKECDVLKVCAADFFRVLIDGKFICYGPSRTAAGYSRIKEINIPTGAKRLIVEVLGYNVSCFCCDRQLPFFGAEALSLGSVVYSTCDFTCGRDLSYDRNVSKYSSQRGFVEKYDLNKRGVKPVKPYGVKAPVIIDGLKETSDYGGIDFSRGESLPFNGFRNVIKPNWMDRKEFFTVKKPFDFDADFIDLVDKGGYTFNDFKLKSVHTGFIKVEVDAKTPTRLFFVMDELDINESGFRRSGCNDVFVVDVPRGKSSVTTFEPYSLKYVKAIYKGVADIKLTMITLENNRTVTVNIKGNDKLDAIVNAARQTFNQNVTDIFMDCASRERAGWLCDSYFMGFAENLFMKNNDVERAFLENILIAKTEELDKNMLPKCFPAQHRNTAYYEGKNNLYIPNWAMFFVLELKAYFDRTGDKSLVDLAKNRVYGLIEFLDKYLNEYGLLENLEGWVFVEWSVCNEKEYLKGVNFPTNILFAATLDCISSLYGDRALKERANAVKKVVKELAFCGEFLVDNAIRVDGKLTPCKDHLSETCQYYALFFGLELSYDFKRKMIEKFGPKRADDVCPKVGKSNMFIGNYLRFFWLLEEGENDRFIDEAIAAFYPMATTTGTLWEHNESRASCNHGFASVLVWLIFKALTGFTWIKDGKPKFSKKPKTDYAIEIIYDGKPLVNE